MVWEGRIFCEVGDLGEEGGHVKKVGQGGGEGKICDCWLGIMGNSIIWFRWLARELGAVSIKKDYGLLLFPSITCHNTNPAINQELIYLPDTYSIENLTPNCS